MIMRILFSSGQAPRTALRALAFALAIFAAPFAALAAPDPTVPTLEIVGAVCIDTTAPSALNAAHVATTASTRGSSVFIGGASASLRDATLTIQFRETAPCGASVVRVTMAGDNGPFVFSTNVTATSASVPVVETPNASLFLTIDVQPTTVAGVTTLLVHLRGQGAATAVFASTTIAITDAAGNTSSTTTPETVVVDGTAPTCVITAPPNGGVVGPPPIPISFNVTDGDARNSGIRNPVDPASTTVTFTYFLEGIQQGSDTRAWQTAPFAGGVLGTHAYAYADPQPFDRLRAAATDIVGNACLAQSDVTIDMTAPRLVRALPVSGGFVASDQVTQLTLELYERDASALQTDNVSICNDTDPPSVPYHIALFDITKDAWASLPLDTEQVRTDCGDPSGFPTSPTRSDGIAVPGFGTTGGSGDFFYAYLELTGAAYDAATEPPNLLTRGHTYKLVIENVADAYGNVNSHEELTFRFYEDTAPLRVMKTATSALTSTYGGASEPTVTEGTGYEVEKVPGPTEAPNTTFVNITATKNCLNDFKNGDAGFDLSTSPYLVRNVLTVVADATESLHDLTDANASAVPAPFSITDLLPPYFHVASEDCVNPTRVSYTLFDRSGTPVPGQINRRVTLAPTNNPSPSVPVDPANPPYGMNIDLETTDSSHFKGEKGRRITVPFTSAELPNGIPPGYRIEVYYYTYVTGY